MPIFNSPEQAIKVFSGLFEILIKDDGFARRMRDSQISLHLIQTRPEFELSVTPDDVTLGAPERAAAIRIKMSSDTAHSLWLGKLLMPVALATGKVRIKGNVAKVLEFVPLLQPAFDQYPEIAESEGLPT
ncbi:SCP2 sterol-binding domain-containing protein [Streptomyces sp. NBC_00859]|uniref:SCP2 sterol-binding domain-containing protein n=1 Tax=Streptomyces sp. NBC_00859 TaxID=2903682 RepID=UPI00386528CA|nr:SCP2 sterol-binding domain-containing protein [Streptomyces sp. NBC_00859]